MKIFINGVACSIEAESTLEDALRSHGPFANYPVIIVLNGYLIKDDRLDCNLKDGDCIDIFNLLSGG